MVSGYKVTDRILNCVPSRGTERDWTIDHAIAAGLITTPIAIPDTLDLRDNSWWGIGDQMDSGSCVGWGTGDAVLRWCFVKAGKMPANKKVSVRYIWMAAKETDEYTSYPTTFIELEGTSLKAALDIARKFGVVTDDVLPFRVADSGGKPTLEMLYRGGTPQTLYSMAAQLKIASYYNLVPSQATKLSTWKNWLAANGGPILTALGVDATWDSVRADGKLDVYQPNTVRGGHCVSIVGYTPDRFIIRNSWGTGWADKGYAYASMGYAQAAFNEAYGVVV
jgi:hypothetical protein